MADLIQGAMDYIPSFSVPQVNTQLAIIISMGAILALFLILIIYKWRVYGIKILELEDRGRSSLTGRLLDARIIEEHGTSKYQLWGNKKLRIPKTPSDSLIPLRTLFGYKDIIIMHRDKNGDYRPWKVIVDKSQVPIKKYIQDGVFNLKEFLNNLFPILKIDNLKMRSWFNLMTKETMAMYQPQGEFLKKYGSMMFILFIIFCIFLGVYLLFFQ